MVRVVSRPLECPEIVEELSSSESDPDMELRDIELEYEAESDPVVDVVRDSDVLVVPPSDVAVVVDITELEDAVLTRLETRGELLPFLLLLLRRVMELLLSLLEVYVRVRLSRAGANLESRPSFCLAL